MAEQENKPLPKSFQVQADQLDDFDLKLRRLLIIAYILGSPLYVIASVLWPHLISGDIAIARAVSVCTFLFGLAMPFLPWKRFGRNLFIAIQIVGLFLIAWMIFITGGSQSSFMSFYIVITMTAGLYHNPIMTSIMGTLAILLGYLPYFYETPNASFLGRQLAISFIIFLTMLFHHQMIPELLRRARRTAQLRQALVESQAEQDALTQENHHLARQARLDPLTGLFNHGMIVGLTDTMLDYAAVHQQHLAVLFFDLDHFKQINDTYGHLAGDQVLQGIARRAAGLLRRGDRIGRYGGEEFLVLLPDTNETEALAIAERLRQTMASQPFLLDDGIEISVTISVGVAGAQPGEISRTRLLHSADLALYQAKETGRDRVCLAV